MTHVCNRNSKNHTDEIQAAWINGVGIETWGASDENGFWEQRPSDSTLIRASCMPCCDAENVWSVYNRIVPRDGEMIRRMATMMRFLGGKHGFFANLDWIPRVPVLQSKEVFATLGALSQVGKGFVEANQPRSKGCILEFRQVGNKSNFHQIS